MRGQHSSGIAHIGSDDNLLYHKLPVNGSFFVEDRAASTLIEDAGDAFSVTIGHNRHATAGAINLNNAHPFLIANEDRELIGVHNGTLNGWSYHETAKGYTVDSEWALAHIFNEGADAFEDFYGAFCFVWWDSDENNILNIALNAERPMHVAFLDNGEMIYASEAGMLAWLAERNDLKIEGDILKLTPHHWYKFDINNPKEFTRLKIVDSSYYYSARGTSSGNGSARTGSTTPTTTSTSTQSTTRGEAPWESETTVRAKVRSLLGLDKTTASTPPVSAPEHEGIKLAKEIGVYRKSVDFFTFSYNPQTRVQFGYVDVDGDWQEAKILNTDELKDNLSEPNAEPYTVRIYSAQRIDVRQPGVYEFVVSKPSYKLHAVSETVH